VTTPSNPVPGDLAAVAAAEAKAEADQKADDAVIDADIAQAEKDEAAQVTPPPPPPPTPSFSAVASGTSITVTWANVPSNPTKVGRSSGGSADGGPWDTTEYSPVPTFTGSGTWTFLFLIPGALYTLTLYEANGSTMTAKVTVPAAAPAALSITTASLPAATVGTPYSEGLVAAGGTPPYSWALTSGTLPAPMALSSVGTIAGTPAGAVDVPITAQVSDKSNPVLTAKASFSFIANLKSAVAPMVDSGQLPASAGALPTTVGTNIVFNSTQMPPQVAEGWYNATNAFQNDTNMVPARVILTTSGMQLWIATNPTTGAIVTSDPQSPGDNPGYLFVINKPTFIQYSFTPQTASNGTGANWQELWYTSINNWLIETDLVESLGGGTYWFHVHDNNNAVVPTGIEYTLNAGEVNTVGVLHLPSGLRYCFVNGLYKGTMQGYVNTTIENMLVMGNSVSSGATPIPGYSSVQSAQVFA
jgi:hypothetical protein